MFWVGGVGRVVGFLLVAVGRCARFRVPWLVMVLWLSWVWIVSGQVSGFRAGRCGGLRGSFTGVRGLLSFLIRRLSRSSGWLVVRHCCGLAAHAAGCSPAERGSCRLAGAVLGVCGTAVPTALSAMALWWRRRLWVLAPGSGFVVSTCC